MGDTLGGIPISIAGIVAILLIALALSTRRRAIRLRVVGPAFAMQIGIAVLVLHTSWGQAAIAGMAGGVASLLDHANAGTRFIFGPLAEPTIGGRSFALAALPAIIFFASLVSILYYLGVMQRVIRWAGGAIQLVTGISRVESLCAAANIFVGQSESPLVIRPYLSSLAPSQLFTVMSVGMAGVAGTILAAYAALLGEEALPYLLAAAFMSAPGGLLMAKIIMPDDPQLETEPDSRPSDSRDEPPPANVIMAASQGAQTGIKLAAMIAAMLLAFIALVSLINGMLAAAGSLFGYPDLSFQGILGTIFAPVMFLIGIPWEEAGRAGGLLGEKIVLNEFVAFISLGNAQEAFSQRSYAIITFALCGFANVSSIAIQMAVTGGLAPNQKPTIARFGPRALAAGCLANLMSAALAALLLPL